MDSAPQPPAFGEIVRVFARIGLISFGGPAAQIAIMNRLIVEERRWIGEARFLRALNYCMLLPGPEAQQLATYIGWLLGGVRGGLAAGILFVAPGALVMLALSMIYAGFGETPLVDAVFYGVKTAVLAIVAEALIRIGRRALKGAEALAIAALAFVALFAFAVPFPLVVLAALVWGFGRGGDTRADTQADMDGLADRLIAAGGLEHTRARAGRSLRAAALSLALWLLPVAGLFLALGESHVFTVLAGFFSLTSVVTFGGAYAVLAYVAQAAVETYGWLTPEEMLKGLALAETTPGPLILVLPFVGFLAGFRESGALDPWLGGIIGWAVTLWVIFAPSFLWIFAGAPYAEAVNRNRRLAGALSAVTAGVVGVIASLALWFALHVLFAGVGRLAIGPLALPWPDWTTLDPVALGLAAAAFVLVFRFHLGVAALIGLAAAAGLALHLAGL